MNLVCGAGHKTVLQSRTSSQYSDAEYLHFAVHLLGLV